LNCEYGQGYFFSKPLEAADAGIFINDTFENTPFLLSQHVANLELNM
jgi:hypothetical protein